MASETGLLRAYERLRNEGTRLAGGLTDLGQRAAVYHHLFEHSGKNHIFPLIAAHGALWAKGYFAFGMRLGSVLRWQSLSHSGRAQRMEHLVAFANAFREINRRVCVDTYASYHFTRIFGSDPLANQFVEATLLDALNQMHAARREKRELSNDAKRDIFRRFFLNEQEYVVGPSVQHAAADFDWPLMKFIALKPIIRFSYFPRGSRLFFRQFTNRQERVTNGLRAFDWGTKVGWNRVEAALEHYDVMPSAFFANSEEHFEKLRTGVLAGSG